MDGGVTARPVCQVLHGMAGCVRQVGMVHYGAVRHRSRCDGAHVWVDTTGAGATSGICSPSHRDTLMQALLDFILSSR